MATRAWNVLSLATGSGMLEEGINVALGDKGCNLVGICEREASAAAYLVGRMEKQTMGDVPIWDDISTFPGRLYRNKVDILTAGFPCQPFSQAGKRLGVKDERHLWPRIAELVGEIKPNICFFENVAGHLTLGFDQVKSDLERLHYRVEAGLFTAAEVGAGHERKRLFILAVAEDSMRVGRGGRDLRCNKRDERAIQAQGLRGGMADTGTERLQGDERRKPHVQKQGKPSLGSTPKFRLPHFAPGPQDQRWPEIIEHIPQAEPAIRFVADGMALGHADSLRLVGNGVVPLQAAYAFVTLAAIITEGA